MKKVPEKQEGRHVKMRKELLAEEFVEAYNDYEKYINSVLEMLQNPALEYLVLGAVKKKEREVKALLELQRNGMSTDEAFRIGKAE